MKAYRKPSGCYIELPDNTSVSELLVQCAPRPSKDHVFADVWKSNPMAETCWRLKTAVELDAEKTEQAANRADYKLVDLAKAQVDWNTITDLKTKFPTFAEYKQAIIDRY